jgi:hypothetical protein
LHLAHGDVVPDADGDGYTKVNSCGIGSQNDCVDNNAAINDGATEICDNGIDDNCNGQIDENCITSVTSVASFNYLMVASWLKIKLLWESKIPDVIMIFIKSICRVKQLFR